MQNRLINHYDANIWENIFDQTTANANNGLRMPFCNKATWVKTDYGTKKPSVENRHAFPVGAIEFSFKEREFSNEAEKLIAKQFAIDRIDQAAESMSVTLTDQKNLVGDRTQYKQSDKNTIHRTSAFFAAMRAAGGDTREILELDAQWTERVIDPKSLSEPEVATWIRRGSCRRPNTVVLSSCDKKVVEAFERADLEFFVGHTLESLRETSEWQKMTPAAQAGLKARFRKYKTSLAVVREERIEEEKADMSEDEENGGEEAAEYVAPPMDTDEVDDDGFDVNHDAPLSTIRRFRGTIDEFKALLTNDAIFANGALIHHPMSVTWVAPKVEEDRSWDSCLLVRSGGGKNNQVSVSLYYACGKVVVSSLNRNDTRFNDIMEAVEEITQPDDGLYYQITLPKDPVYEGFPLPDLTLAQNQRDMYERKWALTVDI
jgi:hypothetical protein